MDTIYSLDFKMKLLRNSFHPYLLIPCLFLSLSSFMFISCDDNPAESVSNVSSDRLIYSEIDEPYKCYKSDVNGDPHYLFSFRDFNISYYPGNYIVNTSRNKLIYYDENTSKLYISNFDGSGEIALDISIPVVWLDMQLLPDGNEVLCQTYDAIYKFDMNGNITRIDNASPSLKKPSFDYLNDLYVSADGSRYVYSIFDNIGPCTLVVRNIDGSIYKSYSINDCFFPMLGSGNMIYYLRNHVLYSKNMNNDEEKQLTSEDLKIWEYAINPVGTCIAFSVIKSFDNSTGLYDTDIYTYNIKEQKSELRYSDGDYNSRLEFISPSQFVWNSEHYESHNFSNQTIMSTVMGGVKVVMDSLYFLGADHSIAQ